MYQILKPNSLFEINTLQVWFHSVENIFAFEFYQQLPLYNWLFFFQQLTIYEYLKIFNSKLVNLYIKLYIFFRTIAHDFISRAYWSSSDLSHSAKRTETFKLQASRSHSIVMATRWDVIGELAPFYTQWKIMATNLFINDFIWLMFYAVRRKMAKYE